jgi:hypothetical protein
MPKSPVLFITFNRFIETKLVFNKIREYKPNIFYISSDGPRLDNDKEDNIVYSIRNYILNNIDWECEVHTLFQDSNLGCKSAVSGAINWFFRNVDEGIILEDDCLPSISFFLFCEKILSKYRYDPQVYHIDGSNFCDPVDKMLYHYSRYALIWGWASWRRAWFKYNIEMIDYPHYKSINFLDNIFTKKYERKFWYKNLDLAYNNKIDTWDYQWFYAIWKNEGLTIRPNYNMIKNIGFNKNATHTTNSNKVLDSMISHEIDLSLITPTSIYTNSKLDEQTSKKRFNLGKSFFQLFFEKLIYYLR